MTYYKVFTDDSFIGVQTSDELFRYVVRRDRPTMLIASPSECHYIHCGDSFYHATWMKYEEYYGMYPTANVVEITKEEYDSLSEAIEVGEEIHVEAQEEIHEANTELEVYKRADTIRERLDHIEQALIELAQLLTEGE